MSEIAIHGASGARFRTSLLSEIRADRWLYACIALYVGAAGLLAVAIGERQDFHPFLYLADGVAGAFGVLVPIAVLLRAAIVGAIRQPLTPLTAFGRELVRTMQPRFAAGFLLFCAILVFYGSFTSVKNLLPDLFRIDWDVRLANIDRALFWGNDPATVLSQAIGPRGVLAIDFVYSRLWFIALLGISTWAALSTRYAHLRMQFFMSLLLCWILLGNVLAGIFLSGGPIYYDELTHDPFRFAALHSSLSGTKAEVYAYYLWDLSQGKTIGLGTGISAFPSMHISISVLLTFYVWAVDRRFGLIGALFTIVMLVGSVRLGWHYAIDGYASIVLTPIVWWAVAWLQRRGETSRLAADRSAAVTPGYAAERS